MMRSQIAVVDDCETSVRFYKEWFGHLYEAQYFDSWQAAIYILGTRSSQPSLFVADLGDWEEDSFFAAMRGSYRAALENRVIIVSKVDDSLSVRNSLEIGAADYLVKPVNRTELLVKIDRLLKRNETAFPKLEWDPIFHRVRSSNLTVSLTAKEFQILTLLKQANGAPLSRESIIKGTWGGVSVAAKSLDVHLFHLRRKIEPLGMEVVFLRPNCYKLGIAVEVDAGKKVGLGFNVEA